MALWIYGVIDCAQTPRHRMPAGLSKPIWLGITILVPAIGALAWLVISRLAQADGGTKLPKRRSKGPTAPDDDPEFLANLDWQARKAHYQRQKAEQEKAAREAAAAQAAAAGSGDPMDAAREQSQVARDAAAESPGSTPASSPVGSPAADPAAETEPAADAATAPSPGEAAAPGESSADEVEDPASPARPRSIEEELAALEAQFDDDGEDPPAR